MKNLQKKLRIYLITMLLISVSIITLIVLILLKISSIDLLTSALIIIAVILTLLLLQVYGRFDYLKHLNTYNNLISKNKKPFKINKINLLDNINKILVEEMNYNFHHNSKDFKIYYKVGDGLTKRKRHRTLFAVLVFKENISFVDHKSTYAFERLEKALHKKEKYNQRVFIQLKESTKEFSKTEVEDANKIFFINSRKANVVVINVLYYKPKELVYFLFSDEVKIPYYLKRGYDEIDKIIS